MHHGCCQSNVIRCPIAVRPLRCSLSSQAIATPPGRQSTVLVGRRAIEQTTVEVRSFVGVNAGGFVEGLHRRCQTIAHSSPICGPMSSKGMSQLNRSATRQGQLSGGACKWSIDQGRFRVEVVQDDGVDGCELLKAAHSPESQHGSLASSEAQVGVLDPVVRPASHLLLVGLTSTVIAAFQERRPSVVTPLASLPRAVNLSVASLLRSLVTKLSRNSPS